MCSTNIDDLISEGVGGAATEYCKIKENLYHDLDFNKYEFLPFIMEATGGLSKAAHGFLREMKMRWDSLNCLSKFDCSYINDKKPLHSALNVELQRANSRMILERTPGLDGLIDSAMVKCEQSVAKKRDDAIDTLQLSRLRPARVHEEIKVEENRLELDTRACGKELTIKENDDSQGKPLRKKKEREWS